MKGGMEEKGKKGEELKIKRGSRGVEGQYKDQKKGKGGMKGGMVYRGGVGE